MLKVHTPGGTLEVTLIPTTATLQVDSTIRGTNVDGRLLTLRATVPLVGDVEALTARSYTWADGRNGGGSGRSGNTITDQTVRDRCADLVARVRDAVVAAGRTSTVTPATELVIVTDAGPAAWAAAHTDKFGYMFGDVTAVARVSDGVSVLIGPDHDPDDATRRCARFLADRGIGARVHARTSYVTDPFTPPAEDLTLTP